MQITHSFVAKVRSGRTDGIAEINLVSYSDYPLSYNLYVPAQDVTWVFARDLLSDPFKIEGEEIGRGDVRTTVDGEHFLLTLESPEGEATLILPALSVLDFILESDTHIPSQRVDDTISADLELFLATLDVEE